MYNFDEIYQYAILKKELLGIFNRPAKSIFLQCNIHKFIVTITYIYFDLHQTVSDCDTWQGQPSRLIDVLMSGGGGQGARSGCIVGPQKAKYGARCLTGLISCLICFCTPFRPPVYGSPGVRGNEILN